MEMDDEAVEPRAELESARTTGRMSARSQRVEVITRGEQWRRWRSVVDAAPRRRSGRGRYNDITRWKECYRVL